ncbi:fungal specific transcription factor [Cryptococcus neoformans]|nr:fungal specific transcription factor [Cryptococcus neoformans var. grubii]OXH45213.1 fungal specific transcription factor [Cryptococcus neoformans var. grubii]OXH65886.1 fungal specific transcription factor [Cryptococcus neoformans var. grubii]
MLGQYHGMSAQLAFHDESQWPEGLEKWEVQERRCLYWSIYTLDVFASSVWGSVIRHRSCQSFVSYPDHRLDDALSLSPTLAGELDTVNWIQGWNTVTDLYRAMEKVMDVAAYQNQRAAPHKPPDLPIPFGRPALSVIESWPVIRDRYDALPSVFKETKPLTGDFVDNVCSFQAVDLSVTLQRKGCSDGNRLLPANKYGRSMSDRRRAAGRSGEYTHSVHAVDQLISAPFLHQLSAVGSLLGSVVQGPLTISTYLHIRQILLSFANLLACLETPFIPGGGSAKGFLSISPESISSCSQRLTTEDRTITFFGVNRPQSPTPLEQRQTLHHRLIHKSTVQSRPKLLLSVMQKNRWMKVVLNCHLLPH